MSPLLVVADPQDASRAADLPRHGRVRSPGYGWHHASMTQPDQSAEQQLEEIGAQLAWVRDYL
jgi:hypothetical protein